MFPLLSLSLVLQSSCAFAGWSDGKGSSWHRNSSWNGFGQSWHRHGKGGSKGGFTPGNVPMYDALSLIVDVIQDRSNRKRSKRARSASMSSDSSRDSRRRSRHGMSKELKELRKFREDAQAAAEARKQANKEKREKEEREAQFKALEEKVLSSLPQGLKDKRTPPARAHGEKAAPNPRADISALAARLIEALFDKQVNCQGVTSWEDVEQRLTSLDAKVLREIVESKFPDDAVPRIKAQRVAKLMELAMSECSVWTESLISKGLEPALAKTSHKRWYALFSSSGAWACRHSVHVLLLWFWCRLVLPRQSATWAILWDFQLCPCHQDYHLGLCWNNPSNPTNHRNPHLITLHLSE